MAAGIDDIAIYIPQLYVEASDFAKARGLDPEKLERGLGISQMAIVDTNQDPACLAANACLNVMQKAKLTPDEIGRLYVATESSLDESKAMNSDVIGMLEQVYGEGTFGKLIYNDTLHENMNSLVNEVRALEIFHPRYPLTSELLRTYKNVYLGKDDLTKTPPTLPPTIMLGK